MKLGYMTFMAEAPMIGLRTQPGSAPFEEGPKTFDAEGWAEAYSLYETREAADEAAKDHQETIQQAVADGDMEDGGDEPDFVMPVAVHDDGRLEIRETPEGEAIETYTAAQIYGAFGMKLPEPPAADADPAP